MSELIFTAQANLSLSRPEEVSAKILLSEQEESQCRAYYEAHNHSFTGMDRELPDLYSKIYTPLWQAGKDLAAKRKDESFYDQIIYKSHHIVYASMIELESIILRAPREWNSDEQNTINHSK